MLPSSRQYMCFIQMEVCMASTYAMPQKQWQTSNVRNTPAGLSSANKRQAAVQAVGMQGAET